MFLTKRKSRNNINAKLRYKIPRKSNETLEFTSKDAVILQQKLTDVMTDIDMRISLMERDIQWVKILNSPIPKPSTDEATTDWMSPDPPMPAPTSEPSPRYDFRQEQR